MGSRSLFMRAEVCGRLEVNEEEGGEKGGGGIGIN